MSGNDSDENDTKKKSAEAQGSQTDHKFSQEELDFIQKIRNQISLEDEDSSQLIASYLKMLP